MPYAILAAFVNVVPGARFIPLNPDAAPVTLAANARVVPPGNFETDDPGQVERLVRAGCLMEVIVMTASEFRAHEQGDKEAVLHARARNLRGSAEPLAGTDAPKTGETGSLTPGGEADAESVAGQEAGAGDGDAIVAAGDDSGRDGDGAKPDAGGRRPRRRGAQAPG